MKFLSCCGSPLTRTCVFSYCINVFVYFRCMESVKYLPMFTLKSNYKATPVQFVKVDQSITETLLCFCQLHCIKQKIIYSVLATESNQTLFCSHNSSNTVTFLSPTSVFLSKALPHVGTTLHFFFQQISKTVRRFSDQKTSKRKSFQNMSLLSLVNRTVQTLESEVGADWRIMTHRKWCGGRESDPDPCSEDSSLQY